MRHFISAPVFAVSLILANPAMAQDVAPETHVIEKLNDPEFQDGIAAMMSGLVGAMMELPVGKIAASMEKAIPDKSDRAGKLSRIAPDATLGDLAARDNPDFERDMNKNVRKGTAMMGIVASEFAAMLPQLRAMGEKMKRRMDEME